MLIPWVTIRQISATGEYIVSVGRSNAVELLVFCHSNIYIFMVPNQEDVGAYSSRTGYRCDCESDLEVINL